MIIRSKAPLRIGLAGGGSDVAPFSKIYGGCVLNTTINLYSYCTIIPKSDGKIKFFASDIKQTFSFNVGEKLNIDKTLPLLKGVYNYMLDFAKEIPSCEIYTHSDATNGSGLGGSSSMVIAIMKAFCEFLNFPMEEYQMAKLAVEIERSYLGFSGGKQDQYAAVFGGINFIEFNTDGSIIVNPLKIKKNVIEELQSRILLYFTGISRDSASIINEQISNTKNKNLDAIEATKVVKEDAIKMKKALLLGDLDEIATILGHSWEHKKKMASAISNPTITEAFDVAIKNGAISGKVSGAGGGGFITFFVLPEKKYTVAEKLRELGGKVEMPSFVDEGAISWRYDNDRNDKITNF